MDHGDALLVSSDHPSLDHLCRHQLLQHEGGDVLIVRGVYVGKIALDGLERAGETCHVSTDTSIYLEREREEISSDLSEAVDADVVIASIVQVLDITHFCVGVVGDNLTSVPT